MLKSTVNEGYIALYIDSDEHLNETSAEAIVRETLSLYHIDQWEKIHIDLFTSNKSTLLLARPGENIKIKLANYALPFLSEYFTE